MEAELLKMFPEFIGNLQDNEKLLEEQTSEIMNKVCENHPEYLLK